MHRGDAHRRQQVPNHVAVPRGTWGNYAKDITQAYPPLLTLLQLGVMGTFLANSEKR